MAWVTMDRIAKRIGSDSYADLSTDAKQRLTQIAESIEQALQLPPWNFRLSASTVTEYLPRQSHQPDSIDLADYSNENGKVIPIDYERGSPVLQLSYAPVLLSGLQIWEDLSAYGGQGSGAFGSSTLLVEGVNYFLDCDRAGFSASGKVHRLGANWPTSPRCVKVTYRGGPQAQATYDTGPGFTDVLEEVITNCVLNSYSFHEQQRTSFAAGDNGLTKTSESLGKFSQGYGAPQGTVNGSSWQFGALPDLLPEELTRPLSAFVNVGALLR